MSEFINREDAIEAMTTARDTHCINTSDGEDYISYDMAQNFLRELPYSTALEKLFEALNKAYTCPSNLLDKAEALNDIMLAYKHFRGTQNRMSKEVQIALKDYFKEKDDWYEKCLKCQHSYRKNNDSDMIYCRCRRGKCNFKEVENKNAESEGKNDKRRKD